MVESILNPREEPPAAANSIHQLVCVDDGSGQRGSSTLAAMRPVDPISHAEAARILGCSVRTVARHIWSSRLTSHGTHPSLSRVEVEALACQVYRWRRTLHDPDSYWVTGARAAELLGISPSRLDQLATAECSTRTERHPYADTHALCDPVPRTGRRAGDSAGSAAAG
jgi:hypothetical protein